MDKAPTSLGGVATVWQGGVAERSVHVKREEEIKTRRGVVDGAGHDGPTPIIAQTVALKYLAYVEGIG